jgi:hypothetical protein
MSSVGRRLVSSTAEPPASESRRKRGAAQRHEPLRSVADPGAARLERPDDLTKGPACTILHVVDVLSNIPAMQLAIPGPLRPESFYLIHRLGEVEAFFIYLDECATR